MSNFVRSAAKQRICKAALEHFVCYGYDGASLQQIAEMVGIRKASIYAHFTNKDALFLTLLDDAINVENQFVDQCFAKQQNLPGQCYCDALKQHYQHALHFRFLLRTAYVPPQHLAQSISALYSEHLRRCETHISLALKQHSASLDVAYLSQAYLGVIDSLHIELLYAGTADFDKRLDAMWRLFATALH